MKALKRTVRVMRGQCSELLIIFLRPVFQCKNSFFLFFLCELEGHCLNTIDSTCVEDNRLASFFASSIETDQSHDSMDDSTRPSH